MVIIGATLVLTACASYTDTTQSVQLTENVHRVSMKGNAFNDPNDAQDFALLKAAEVTLDAGHRYFVINAATDTTRVSQFVDPGRTRTTTQGSSTYTGRVTGYNDPLGGTANIYGTSRHNSTSETQTRPDRVYNFVKPGVDVMIETFTDKPSVGHFDAQEIVKFIGPRLNPQRWAK